MSTGGAVLLLLLSVAGAFADVSTPGRQRWRAQEALEGECAGAGCGGRTGAAPSVEEAVTPASPATSTVEAPGDLVDRVTFSSTLPRLTGLAGEDREAFLTDYATAVANGVRQMGITSTAEVSYVDATRSSGELDTMVTLANDPAGAELLQRVLAIDPRLMYPAFKSVGPISITAHQVASRGPGEEGGAQVPGVLW